MQTVAHLRSSAEPRWILSRTSSGMSIILSTTNLAMGSRSLGTCAHSHGVSRNQAPQFHPFPLGSLPAFDSFRG